MRKKIIFTKESMEKHLKDNMSVGEIYNAHFNCNSKIEDYLNIELNDRHLKFEKQPGNYNVYLYFVNEEVTKVLTEDLPKYMFEINELSYFNIVVELDEEIIYMDTVVFNILKWWHYRVKSKEAFLSGTSISLKKQDNYFNISSETSLKYTYQHEAYRYEEIGKKLYVPLMQKLGVNMITLSDDCGRFLYQEVYILC